MKQQLWRVGADVPASTRALLRRLYPPRFRDIHLSTITWAFGVEQSYPFDDSVQDCIVHGIHRGSYHEAFVVQLGGRSHRPDGNGLPLFLALSTDAGTKPAEAGEIDFSLVETISPVFFAAQLKLFPIFQKVPQRNPAATAGARY